MDIVDASTRSKQMSGIRSIDTAPDLLIRSMLHKAGFRFRLHTITLPGKPDLWLARYRAVIEVNGCFWHGHGHGCHLYKLPATRTEFWQAKISANSNRDSRHLAELKLLGIRRLIVWECALKGRYRHDPERLLEVIAWWLTSYCESAEIAGGSELIISH
ncbi:very short patch repair endonuclease [Aeromonas media]|uniref:very short patch repair endonuclease n=1 Tax=Aeromonas media TaxID=651 RepID=UPI00385176E0